MNSDKLFRWLVRFHIEHNLPIVLPHINDGKADFLIDGDIGYDHRTPNEIKRFLIVANGDTLVEKLIANEMISESEELEFERVPEYSDFNKYYHKHKGDGAYVFHLNDARIARVMEIANQHPKNLSSQYKMLPPHFISLDGRVGNRESGNKTRLAIRIPYLPNLIDEAVHTYQIKGTIHSELGLGIVTHFSKEGMEMFYFDHNTDNNGSQIDESKGITGIHEKYQKQGELNYKIIEKKQISLADYVV
ncbi:MAG: hypothetical protein ABH824_06100 [Nanoarchaeota archaeon]|nr:hypothetical protein [Nanoarchaeota archaeon]MBU1631993.1 hypothetical protein [Nanoarchaeota archaeon]MBU1876617.1 hypothetical protein [Nanoarchaeota archaeon]